MEVNMVNTMQGLSQVPPAGIEKLPESVSIKQTVKPEQPVQSEDLQKRLKKNTDTSKVDFSMLSDRLKEILNEKNLYLKFDKDKESNKMILKIIDTETKEIVQQIPPEISLKIARYIASLDINVNITNFKA